MKIMSVICDISRSGTMQEWLSGLGAVLIEMVNPNFPGTTGTQQEYVQFRFYILNEEQETILKLALPPDMLEDLSA